LATPAINRRDLFIAILTVFPPLTKDFSDYIIAVRAR